MRLSIEMAIERVLVTTRFQRGWFVTDEMCELTGHQRDLESLLSMLPLREQYKV